VCVLTKGILPDEWFRPTILEPYVTGVKLRGHEVELILWDTAGQEDYDRLRVLSYPDSNVVLICYSIACLESLENVAEKVCLGPKDAQHKTDQWILHSLLSGSSKSGTFVLGCRSYSLDVSRIFAMIPSVLRSSNVTAKA
jgi:hypothetical protein